ncbi:hypothetical protein UFOVP336_57 [uncultured Caudovirales phage]|jgi:hypothetical protein|uniref:Uncharacterized protein n=1 Tax=uncultured Caudovirales phage TaxID=2100421 RepID=A0A6J5M048_9CAUD|nr:hypothetical protein UFOVP336_57 [uncultured Caudovirales phage]
MAASDVKETMDGIWAKKAERKAAKEERIANGEVKERDLLVERLPEGLYMCRFDGGGKIPEEFEGKHTNRNKLAALAIRRWGNDDKLRFV